MRTLAGRVATLAITVSLALDHAAQAAGDGEQVGENVGKLLGSWARSVFVGVAAIVAVMFLCNRRFTELAVFLLAAVLVGGFVLAPNEIAGTIRDIWHTIAG
jgi:hypothetical protein